MRAHGTRCPTTSAVGWCSSSCWCSPRVLCCSAWAQCCGHSSFPSCDRSWSCRGGVWKPRGGLLADGEHGSRPAGRESPGGAVFYCRGVGGGRLGFRCQALHTEPRLSGAVRGEDNGGSSATAY